MTIQNTTTKKSAYKHSMPGISISRIVRDYEFTMPHRHMHDEYEIYYLIDGERYYFIENQIYHVKKGNLVLIGRNQIHKTVQYGESHHERITVMLQEDFLNRFLSVTGEISPSDFFRENQGVISLALPEQDTVLSLLNEISSEMSAKAPGYRLMILSKLTQLFVFCQRLKSSRPHQRPDTLSGSVIHQKVSEAASYISEHYAEASSLEKVADHFYISKNYLSRIFKQVTGYTVNEYINVNRILHARRLLAESNMSITQIAEAVGYESITYFEKVFRSQTSTSPLKYRKREKEMLQNK